MKKEGSWLIAVVTFLVGVLLIVFHGEVNLLTWIVEAIGVLIVVPSVWLILANVLGSKENRNPVILTLSVVTLCFGVWICCAPDTFAEFIIFLFATLLIIFGFWHIAIVVQMSRMMKVSWVLYIMPSLLIAAGLVFIFTDLNTMQSVVELVMGICLVASSVSTLLEYYNVPNSRKHVSAQ